MNVSHHFLDIYMKFMRTIKHTAIQCGRSVDAVRLMAVSKNVGIDDIMQAYHVGQRLFGESRVQEAEEKFSSEMLTLMPDIELHCIGTIQGNKIKKVLKLFSCIQSIGSIPLLAGLAKISKTMPTEIIKTRGIFFQVNPLASPAKSGFCDYDTLLKASYYALEYDASPIFRVYGLMTIAPFYKDDEARTRKETQQTFALTRLWKERLEKDMKYDYNLELSMGMSSDFVSAIREHSTMLRIGSALFGK